MQTWFESEKNAVYEFLSKEYPNANIRYSKSLKPSGSWNTFTPRWKGATPIRYVAKWDRSNKTSNRPTLLYSLDMTAYDKKGLRIQEQLQESAIRKIHKVLNEVEVGGTIPQRTRFVIKESFKQMRRMMEMLELRIDGNDMTLEDYENIMSALEEKLTQIRTKLKSHVV